MIVDTMIHSHYLKLTKNFVVRGTVVTVGVWMLSMSRQKKTSHTFPSNIYVQFVCVYEGCTH